MNFLLSAGNSSPNMNSTKNLKLSLATWHRLQFDTLGTFSTPSNILVRGSMTYHTVQYNKNDTYMYKV